MAATLGGLAPGFAEAQDAFVRRTTINGLGSNTAYKTFVNEEGFYVATSNGLSISTDGGQTFTTRTVANSGLNSNTVNAVFAVGSNVYAATTSGLSISSDGGATFTGRTTANGLGSNNVYAVWASGSSIYVATGGGLSISTDGGTSFSNKTTASGLGSNTVRDVYVVGSTIYAATSAGLSISTNGGTSFVTRTTGQGLGSNNVYAVWASGSSIYVATGGGLSISTDGGTSFSNKTTTSGLGSNSVYDVWVEGTTVYAATGGGLSISTNGGASFTNKTTTNTVGIGSNTMNGVFAANAHLVYVATGNGVSMYTQATPTTLSTSPNPSIIGGTVTMTATVASVSPEATGSVTFKDGGTELGTVALSGGTATFTTSAFAVGTHDLTVVYRGRSYYPPTTSATVSHVVDKIIPSITTVPTATAITYGQTLAGSTLSGGVASVPGTFDFTVPTTAPGAGTSAQGVTFSPTDGATYATVAVSVDVTVFKANPSVITAPTATSITYGQTLASSTLNGGVGSVPGSFAFTTPATAPSAGTAVQGVTFTPADAANFDTVSLVASVTVAKATPSVTTAPTATAITVGQSLASSTLSGGVGSVPGTFGFTSPGTTPGVGTAAQGITFTPTDTANYEAAATSANVLVLTSLEAWRVTHFGTPGDAGTGSNTNVVAGDNLTNLEKFAYGLDPATPVTAGVEVSGGAITRRGRPAIAVSTTATSVGMKARFVRRKGVGGDAVAYAVQFSPDVSFASPLTSSATPVVVASDGDFEVVEVSYPLFLNGRKTGFFRVNVSEASN